MANQNNQNSTNTTRNSNAGSSDPQKLRQGDSDAARRMGQKGGSH